MNVKTIFIMIMIILFIALLASGFIGSTDLTPNTPPAAISGPAAADPAAGVSSAAGVLYSPCSGVYTIQSGDTLSHIARDCGIPLADLIAANPAIPDPNVISPGQQINIPAAVAEAVQEVPAPPAVTEAPQEAPAADPPASAEDQGPTLMEVVAAQEEGGTGGVPADEDLLPEGLVPGGIIHVTVKNLPPTTPVTLGIGKAGATPAEVEDRITNEKGELIIHIAIPKTAQPGEQWTVSVMTMNKPKTVVQSVPFTIQ